MILKKLYYIYKKLSNDQMKKSKLFLTPVLKCLLVVAISIGVILFNTL